MPRKAEHIMPPWLKQMDKFLLLNHPEVWASRIHHVFFWGGGVMLLLLVKAWWGPLSLSDLPDPDVHFWLASIPSLLALLPFAYYLSLFSLEKSYGHRAMAFSGFQQLSLAMSLILLVLIPVLYAQSLSERIAQQRDNASLSQEVDQLNMGDVYFPTASYVFEDRLNLEGEYDFEMHRYRIYAYTHVPHLLDTRNTYALREFHSQGHFTEHDRIQQIEAFIRVFNTYSKKNISLKAPEVWDRFKRHQVPVPGLAASKEAVEANLQKIIQAKEASFGFQANAFIHKLLFLMMSVWLALLLLLKTNLRTFSLGMTIAMGAGLLLTGGLDFLAGFLDVYEGKLAFPVFLAVWVFCVRKVWYKKKNTLGVRWRKVALILVTVMLPFMPFVIFTSDRYYDPILARLSIYLGFVITIIAWNIGLNRKFSRLMAEPNPR